MYIKTSDSSNLRKVAIGTIAAIGICALGFIGLTQSVQAALINRTELIPTTYSSSVIKEKDAGIPLGYVKAAYQVKLLGTTHKPTAKDMSAEEAAEKYQLVSGKAVSAEYISQGYTSNPAGISLILPLG